MAARSVHVHRPASVKFGPIDALVGIADIKAFVPADGNGAEPTEIPLSGLAFVDAVRMRVRRGRLESRRQGRRVYVSAASVERLSCAA